MFLPATQSITAAENHIVKLGLVHPIGGGQTALDALVVIDTHGRRRLLLPFGWGAGRYVNDAAGGQMICEGLMEILRNSVMKLQEEIS
jgi:hypothetical protein